MNKDLIKLKVNPPEHAIEFWGDTPGMRFWKNQKNGYTVAVTHFTADPDKNSVEWFQQATKNLTQDKIDQEYHISFESKAGKRVFPYLAMNPGRWFVPPRDIKKNETIIASLDFGSRNPTAIYFHAIDHRGRFHTFSEFYKPSTPSEIARWLKNHPMWPRTLKTVVDPSIFNANQHDLEGGAIKSIASLLEDLGIYNIERGENDRLAGLQRMKEMMRYQEAQSLDPYWSISTDCPKLWWELCGLTYKENTDKQRMVKNEDEDVVKKDDHGFDSCFAAGTLVLTENGYKPIEQIVSGDMVATSLGFHPVLFSGKTGFKKIIELTLSGGEKIKCTEDHPFFLDNGDIRLASLLTNGDTLYGIREWQKNKNLMVSFLEKLAAIIAPMELIAGRGWNHFIERFGSSTKEAFRRIFTFITSMETQIITTYPILNSYLHFNIYPSTEKNKDQGCLSILRFYKSLPRIGIEAKKEENGTANTQKKSPRNYEKIRFKKIVSYAEKLISLLGANSVDPSSAIKIVGQRSLGEDIVYNLTIKNVPEFFVSGVLVHNCKYALLSWNTPSELPEREKNGRDFTLKQIEEEIDERYLEEEGLASLI